MNKSTRMGKPKIVVRYWRGTQKIEATATTYRGAMRIASRNQNSHGPTFWNESGEKLHDDGRGLATAQDIDNHCYSF